MYYHHFDRSIRITLDTLFTSNHRPRLKCWRICTRLLNASARFSIY